MKASVNPKRSTRTRSNTKQLTRVLHRDVARLITLNLTRFSSSAVGESDVMEAGAVFSAISMLSPPPATPFCVGCVVEWPFCLARASRLKSTSSSSSLSLGS